MIPDHSIQKLGLKLTKCLSARFPTIEFQTIPFRN